MKLTSVSLFCFQLLAHIATAVWLLSIPSMTDILLVFLIYFLTGCIGMSVTYHRLLTHKSFKTSKFWEYLGTVFATIGLTGSSLSWTAAHRKHHIYADRIGDPHSPVILGYLRAQWFSMFSQIDIKKSPVISSKFHRAIHKFYLHINLAYGLLLFLFGGWWALVNLWLVPACILWNAGSLINTIGHSSKLGYRYYNLSDKSINNPILGIFMWGEGWHNNHHRHQSRPNIGERWWEIDIGYYFIKLIRQ